MFFELLLILGMILDCLQENQEFQKPVLLVAVEEKENNREDFFGDIPKIKGGVKTAFFDLIIVIIEVKFIFQYNFGQQL